MPAASPRRRDVSLSAIRLVVFDFDGVFSDNRVWTDRGGGGVACWRGDALGLRRLDEVGVDYLISPEERGGSARAEDRIECIGGVADKLTVLREEVERRGVARRDGVPRQRRQRRGCLERSASRSCLQTHGPRSCRSPARPHGVAGTAACGVCDAVWNAKRARGRVTDPLFDLEGRVAVVTGGMGQLGQVYSPGSPTEGMHVASFDVGPRRRCPTAPARTRSTSPTARPIARARRRRREWGVPHVLVNNAGLDSPPDAPAEEVGPFEEYPEAAFDAVMDVNVKGTLLCCQSSAARWHAEAAGRSSTSPRSTACSRRRRISTSSAAPAGETFFKPVAYSVSKSASSTSRATSRRTGRSRACA